MKIMKKLTTLIFAGLLGSALISCTSVPSIPGNASSTQLIQLGQDALEMNNYTAAETYYNAVIQRYGMDTSKYIEARYELGHMYSKKKDYENAYKNYSEILEIFENAEFGSLPQAYKKLAQMGINNLPEKYKNQ